MRLEMRDLAGQSDELLIVAHRASRRQAAQLKRQAEVYSDYAEEAAGMLEGRGYRWDARTGEWVK